jgi:hypothetical protein
MCGCNSVVECHLPMVNVVGSSPIARFLFRCPHPKLFNGFRHFANTARRKYAYHRAFLFVELSNSLDGI